MEGLGLMGLDSSYLSRPFGTAFLWILIASMGLILIIILIPFSGISKLRNLKDKLKKKLLWNAILRTVMQTSLEFSFCCIFTIKYAINDGSMCALLNIAYAYVFAALLCIAPVFYIMFYKNHFHIFHEVESINDDE